MPRPSTQNQRRRELLPIVAEEFARAGYARTTTAALAARCVVPENTLFRLWGGKKRMYLAALDHLYDRTITTWDAHLARGDAEGSAAERLLDHEGAHYGEHGLYRIVFTGLSELDDPDIRRALRAMYRRFHEFVTARIAEHRGARSGVQDQQLAWAVIGMATVAGIGRALRLMTKKDQCDLFSGVGRALLGLTPNLTSPSSTENP